MKNLDKIKIKNYMNKFSCNIPNSSTDIKEAMRIMENIKINDNTNYFQDFEDHLKKKKIKKNLDNFE